MVFAVHALSFVIDWNFFVSNSAKRAESVELRNLPSLPTTTIEEYDLVPVHVIRHRRGALGCTRD